MGTLIKNGLVFDGTNTPPKQLDVLVENGIIAKMATDISTAGHEVLDAKGQWVTPGFIDNHTHYDGELLIKPELGESLRHGVTTIVIGGCSLSCIYADPEDCSDMFTRTEAMPREVILPLILEKKTWNDPKGWIAYMDQAALGPNVASFIGHSDIRAAVMGFGRSLEQGQKPTPEELDRMEAMVTECLDAGFLGLSMQHNPWDKVDGDRYWSKKLPAAYATLSERRRLTKVLRKRGAHLQGIPNLVSRVAALYYMFESASFFGLRKRLKTSMVAMMILKGDPYIHKIIGGLSAFFNKILGADFRMQTFPIPFKVKAQGMDLVIFEEFPTGELARHLIKDMEKRDRTLDDPEYRKQFKKEYKNKLMPKVWQKDFGDAYVLEAPDKSLIGKSFTQISTERHQHPVDTFLDLVVENDKNIHWETVIGNVDPEQYKSLYNNENGIFGFADSGAHGNNMAFFNFPIRVLTYVKDSIANGKPLMTIEKAIWRLTKENADFFNLDAGHLAEGKRADLVLIDPDGLNAKVHEWHEADFLGAALRFVNRSDDAVKLVMVNGNIAWQNGEFSPEVGKARFGMFLKGKHAY
ncbi:N-acyl-D-amino-acid deacylase family protein [Sediminicola luteus]|uniref:Amidohydrolase-related domain-containing protein n=1 Tax=Sediminicola luteus TaxID=319238 RepID=A0A2A4G6U7_9FLAO|nr:amidohydrolase family protein [Sediminicola luteus]PCE64163.1 hypothetical protein B7P33_11035 [Sediminicola luteus]